MSVSTLLDQAEEIQASLVKELFKSINQLQHFSFYRADSIGLTLSVNNKPLPWNLNEVGKLLHYQNNNIESPNVKSWLIENDLKLNELILIARVVKQIQGELTFQYIAKEYQRKDYE